jgi:YidC/Oxa1 family membrane protein insertase
MESQRSILIVGLLIVSYLLWSEWQQDYQNSPSTETAQQAAPLETSNSTSVEMDDVPVLEANTTEHALTGTNSQNNNLISVRTNTIEVKISPKGGDIVSLNLIKYPLIQDSPEPYPLLKPKDQQLYIAQSGLVGANGIDSSPSGRPLYNSDNTDYYSDNDTIVVPLTYSSPDGLQVEKRFIFTQDSHQVTVQYLLINTNTIPLQVKQYAQLKQTMYLPEGSMFVPTYRGAAYSTLNERYEKYSFSDIEDDLLSLTTQGGWLAMLEHYFVSSWIPPQEEVNDIYSRSLSDRYAVIGFTGQTKVIQPGQTIEIETTLYAGPKDQNTLANLAKGLDLTVDYGILWWISQPLFMLLSYIYDLVGNWGFAIILITIVVKVFMYPLTKAQYVSMAKMRNLAPKMHAIKDRVGDDRQKMSQAMMELYKKEKVNPVGGCFPLLLQMPIFLALYWVLLESVELRHADFIFWISDLSVKDPAFVLPILTGLSMWLLQKLQPTTITDPMQQKIMQWMPVAMSLFFFIFPAGLVLYWLVSNIITLIQAKIIYASIDKQAKTKT